MGDVGAKLAELGIVLPAVSRPVAAYVPAVTSGNLLFTSGQLPFIDGVLALTGKVGREVSVQEAAEMARICALNALAAANSVLGSLDQVSRIIKLNGFVSSTPDFSGQPQVINGASEVLEKIFGDRGHHTRAAVGVVALPLDSPVEVDLILEFTP